MAAGFALVEPTSIPADDSVLAQLLYERLRLEISAKHVATRRWLREHVLSVFDEHPRIAGSIDEAIDTLVDANDLIEGSHGRIAAAPSFLVDLNDGVLLFAGALPTQTWVRRGGPPPSVRGAQRNIGPLDATTRAACEAAAAAIGARLISAERWSGLTAAPPANASWIEGLRARHQLGAEPATDDHDAPWLGFVPDASKWAWRRRAPEDDSLLWRRTPFAGYDEYAWTSGAAPSASPWMRLAPDEAARTTWALAASCGAARARVLAGEEGQRVVEPLGRLPRAEYRWLMTLGRRAATPRGFTLPPTRVDAVLQTLGDRLGLLADFAIEEEGAHGRRT